MPLISKLERHTESKNALNKRHLWRKWPISVAWEAIHIAIIEGRKTQQETSRLILEPADCPRFGGGTQSVQGIFDLKILKNACLGYALKALKALNYSENEIKRILTTIESQFDLLSVEDATELYNQENV